jgi:hypothetical protein
MAFLDQRIKDPLDSFNSYGGLCESDGPLNLLSNIFQLIILAAGLFALINLVISGVNYISSQGKPEETQKAVARITTSLIGLLIVVSSFIIMAIISKLLFGDFTFIFNPKIYGPGSCI